MGGFLLTLILGCAGTGKTALVMDDIRQRMEKGESDLLLIVPEQYSHDAERQLCAVCGDKLSLHGETLSFTRLSARVFSETGGAHQRYLDVGGQMLMMHRALESISANLIFYGGKGLRADLLETLLGAIKEFKSCSITADMLVTAAEKTSGILSDKLRDLALIFSAYDGLMSGLVNDPTDRLTLLADKIGVSSLGNNGRMYFDGFNDFTLQELRVIEELLRKKADLSVCLSYDPNRDGEVFELPRRTAERLRRLAAGHGVKVIENVMPNTYERKAPELEFLEKHLFEYNAVKYPSQCGAITVYSAPTMYAECEYAASVVWEIVRSGYRWRDIGVMTRDWEQYRPICENVFEKYGIPFFSGGKTDVIDKPPVALIAAALDAAVFGWEYKSVFRYLKTGLTGVPAESCSEFENYVLKWNIRGKAWETNWKYPPSGYGGAADENVLSRINVLRRLIVEPISRLKRGVRGVGSVGTKLKALNAFLQEIELPQRISEKAEVLVGRGETRLAEEYSQIWDVIKNAMEQMFEMQSGMQTDAVEFRKLYNLVISQYDIGVIPTSLDKTALGGMAMSRRRDLKCLIVLGAVDGKLPMLSNSCGALSDSEREVLAALGMDMPAGIEDRLSREMNMIYSTLTLPSQKLVITYPAADGQRPSHIVKRINSLFGTAPVILREDEYMSASETPCFELALMYQGFCAYEKNVEDRASHLAKAAWEFFCNLSQETSSRLQTANAVLRSGRGRLSETSAQRLYGKELSISPTVADKYYSCPYKHFMDSGLKLVPHKRADFDAPQAGIFMHYVLEGVARDIKAGAGYKNTDDNLCRVLTAHYVEQYIQEYLHNFEGLSDRFVYLFRRLEEYVSRIVLDILDELRKSDFEPLDFELNISEMSNKSKERGIIDRVDGWAHDGRLYLRVVDYKTGKKAFSLSDILHGRDMQMLIYMFALQKHGKMRYGQDIVSAGVLYIPARDIIIKARRNSSEPEIDRMRSRELRRSGLILRDLSVIEAMENGEVKKFLPVMQSKDGKIKGDNLICAEQMVLLDKHIDYMLNQALREILSGEIDCKPYYKSDSDNACLYCDFKMVCAFDEETGDRRNIVRSVKANQVWEEFEKSGKA